MSGGSWDYVYRRFDDVADRLDSSADIRRRHLGVIIRDVAKALHDIEWVDSGDYAPGDEYAAIDSVVGTAGGVHVRALAEQLRADVDYLLSLFGAGEGQA